MIFLGFTWTHSESHLTHLDSLDPTWTPLGSVDLTRSHLDLLDLTWTYFDSLALKLSMGKGTHKLAREKGKSVHKGKGKGRRGIREKGKRGGSDLKRISTLPPHRAHARTRRNNFPVTGGGLPKGDLTPTQPPFFFLYRQYIYIYIYIYI